MVRFWAKSISEPFGGIRLVNINTKVTPNIEDNEILMYISHFYDIIARIGQVLSMTSII